MATETIEDPTVCTECIRGKWHDTCYETPTLIGKTIRDSGKRYFVESYNDDTDEFKLLSPLSRSPSYVKAIKLIGLDVEVVD